MMSDSEVRNFFVFYNNGDTFYFTVTPSLEIYCQKFQTVYEDIRNQLMPGAHSVEFKGNTFSLKNKAGEEIYNLEKYQKEAGLNGEELQKIEGLYIDEDVRITLLNTGKIKYDEKASKIPGLLCEPQLLTEDKNQGFARTLKK